MLTQLETWTTIAAFGVAMFGVVWLLTRRKTESFSSFTVADRNLGTIRGGFSIAVTFIWAPAIFVSSQQSFTSGVPGIFWFMFPNFLCLLLSGWLALKVRKIHPDGFTLTELLANRLGEKGKAAHIALLAVFILWMLMAVVINATAGGGLISTLSGIDYRVAASVITFVALSYSLVSGMRASALTDLIQMIFILGIAFLIVPWVVISAGGLDILAKGIGGLEGNTVNPLNFQTFYAVGILAFLGLFGGWMQDATYYQRVFSIRKEKLLGAFVLGAFAFAVVPILLSVLGFAGAGLAAEGGIDSNSINPAMIGPEVVGQFLGKVGLIVFAIMAFAGLASTLDSAIVAMGALVSVDVFKRYVASDGDIETEENVRRALRYSRVGMIGLAFVGLLISFLNPPILWLFLTYAAIAVGGLAPVLLIIFGRVPKSLPIVISVIVALSISMPSAIIGNLNGNTHLTVWGPIVALLVSTGICLANLKPRSQD